MEHKTEFVSIWEQLLFLNSPQAFSSQLTNIYSHTWAHTQIHSNNCIHPCTYSLIQMRMYTNINASCVLLNQKSFYSSSFFMQGFADVTNEVHTHKIEHTQFLSQCECVGGTFPLLDCIFTLSRERMRACTQIVLRRTTSHDSEKNVPYYFLGLRFPSFNFIFPPLILCCVKVHIL